MRETSLVTHHASRIRGCQPPEFLKNLIFLKPKKIGPIYATSCLDDSLVHKWALNPAGQIWQTAVFHTTPSHRLDFSR